MEYRDIYEFHEIANCFPLMEGKDYDELVASIRDKGFLQQYKIILYEGKILDGRNRYRACPDAHRMPYYDEYKGDDPVGFVAAANLTRRHLNKSQRALIAADLANLPWGIGRWRPTEEVSTSTTISEAARKMRVSDAYVDLAKQIKKEAPELVPAIVAGKMSLHAAREVNHHSRGKWVKAIEAALSEDSQRNATEICRAVGRPIGGSARSNVNKIRLRMEEQGLIEPYLDECKKTELPEPSAPKDPPRPRNDLTLRVRTNHTPEELGYPPKHLQDVEHPDHPGTGRTYMDVHIAKYGRVQHQHTSVIDARRAHENVSLLLSHMRKIAADIKEATEPLNKISSIAEFMANTTELKREKFEECLALIEEFATRTAEYRTNRGPRLVARNGELA